MTGYDAKEVLKTFSALSFDQQMHMVTLNRTLVDFDMELLGVFSDQAWDHLFMTKQGASPESVRGLESQMMTEFQVQGTRTPALPHRKRATMLALMS